MSSAITPARVLEAALESFEWDYQNDNLHTNDYDTTADELIYQAIDSMMVYTRDIHDAWYALGNPESIDMGSAETIRGLITVAVFEELLEVVTSYDIIEAFLESHQGTLETLGVDTSTADTDAAMIALIEYREGL